MMHVCRAVENELIPDLNKVQKRFILSRMSASFLINNGCLLPSVAAGFGGKLLLQCGLAMVEQQVFVVPEIAVAAIFGDEAWEAGFKVSSVTNTTISWLSAKAFSMKSNAASSAALAASCA